MSLRISFDMDGVLADFAGAYRDVEVRLFGPASDEPLDPPEAEEQRQARHARQSASARDAIWRAIESTPDFWTTLAALDAGAVPRIHELTLRHRWEVFFITQRPATAGETVQRQTQRWLVEHGFQYPSVIVLSGGRGRALRALAIDYHVDDSAQNCLDAIADSTARTILVADAAGEPGIASVRKLGIAHAAGVGQALDILEQASMARANPSMLKRLSALVGWK